MSDATGWRSVQADRWWLLGGGLVVLVTALLVGLVAGARYADDWGDELATAEDPDVDWSRLDSYPRAEIPDLRDVADVTAKKQQFFDFLLPMVRHENERLRTIRGQLAAWRDDVAAGTELSEQTEKRIRTLAERYYADPEQPLGDTLSVLLRRVDSIPASLVLAQAANESAWGGSRFARKGNNLFGQWCFSKGCGLVPSGRPEGEIYEVRDFESPALSVRAFLQNLNRHRSYSGLRAARTNLRSQGKDVTGLDLVPHLEAYSTRRGAYVEEIRNMITFNDLLQYDQAAEQAS